MQKEVVYVAAKDVAYVLGVAVATANRRIKEVKLYFAVAKYKRITLGQLCQFFKLDLTQMQKKLDS